MTLYESVNVCDYCDSPMQMLVTMGIHGMLLCPNGCNESHEPPRNSGEGTAVNGPMPLGEKGDALE